MGVQPRQRTPAPVQSVRRPLPRQLRRLATSWHVLEPFQNLGALTRHVIGPESARARCHVTCRAAFPEHSTLTRASISASHFPVPGGSILLAAGPTPYNSRERPVHFCVSVRVYSTPADQPRACGALARRRLARCEEVPIGSHPRPVAPPPALAAAWLPARAPRLLRVRPTRWTAC